MPDIYSWCFFNSTFFQTLIILGTACFTFIVYRLNKAVKIRTAAIIILSQIDKIEESVDYLKLRCVNSGSINETDIYESIPVLVSNEFNANSPIIIKYFDSRDYGLLSKFYMSAERIAKMQREILEFIHYGLKYKAEIYTTYTYKSILDNKNNFSKCKTTQEEPALCINRVRDAMNNIQVQTYLPLHHGIHLENYLKEYYPVSGTTAYGKLKKLSQLKF